jgi:hypothetical protein
MKLKEQPTTRYFRYTTDHAPYPVPGIHDRGDLAAASTPIRRPKTQQEIDRDLEAFEAEERRAIYCDLARFEVLTPTRDKDGSTFVSSLQRGAFDTWLREHDPSELTFSVDHEPAPAQWTSLWASGGRLWGRALVEKGFEDLVELARVVAGCSFAGDVVRSTDRGDRSVEDLARVAPAVRDHLGGDFRGRVAVFNIHEVNLRDAGLATESPADPECRVRAAGNAAAKREQQHKNRALMAELGLIRPAGNGMAWRPRFGA